MPLPELSLYNSFGRRREAFSPRRPGRVGIYVCGITVYDDCHLGHARMLVVFDVVVRYLRARGIEVRYVRNITDIDDKIIRRAAQTGERWDALAERFIRRLHEDERALGIVAPDLEPRATENIGAIVAMIERLVRKGYAYVADNGDVYYSVARFADYGALTGQRPEELRAGARVEPGEGKRDPLDFALWKAEKPGEPAWDTPWGRGRPGWHIECSAMATAALGPHLDIHGGGLDLKFPHHENEIAQSEAATGERFADLWMHNGFVEVNAEKMAKSLGNFTTLRALLQRWPAEALRYFVLSSHYRSPLSYSEERVAEAHAALSRLYLALRGTGAGIAEAAGGVYTRRFHAAMSDDFNTPEAIAVLHALASELNRRRDARDGDVSALGAELRGLGRILGLLTVAPDEFLRGAEHGADPEVERIERLIAERNAARKARDFARADHIRDALAGEGILLEDGADGTLWRRG